MVLVLCGVLGIFTATRSQTRMEAAEEKPLKVKKPKKKKESRTIETMFRTSMNNHIRLSEMADRKAALLVSVNAIIVSVVTSMLVHEFSVTPLLLVPSIGLVVVCLVTITFALLSTKPSVGPSHVADEPNDKLDLLFFGDYTRLSVESYKVAMKTLMEKDETLHDSLLQNIYAQGLLLKRKYRLLKTAYLTFMIGFPLAVVGYLLMLYWL